MLFCVVTCVASPEINHHVVSSTVCCASFVACELSVVRVAAV